MHAIPRSIAIAILIVGCGPGQTLPPGSLEPVKIGMVMSLSGSLEADGRGWRDAARLAVEEVNAAGGVLPGRPLELIIEDDETNPARGMPAAQALVDEGVVAIVGAAASSVSINVAMVAERNHLPQISCCSTSDNLTAHNQMLPESGRFFFRTSAPDILQSIVVAIAANDLMCARLAILHLDDDYGNPFGAAIETNYENRGGTVVANVAFTDGMRDYTTQVTAIRDANPDCVALVAFPGSAGTIVRNWNALVTRPMVTWIGTDGIKGPGLPDEVADHSLIDGFFGTSPITDPASPEYNRFRGSFVAAFGTEPVPFASNNYDATALLALAIARAGTTNGDQIRTALIEVAAPPNDNGGLVGAGDLSHAIEAIRNDLDVDYEGASGNTNFDSVGNVVTPYEIWRYDAMSGRACPGPVVTISGNRGFFCRFRVIPPEDLQ